MLSYYEFECKIITPEGEMGKLPSQAPLVGTNLNLTVIHGQCQAGESLASDWSAQAHTLLPLVTAE